MSLHCGQATCNEIRDVVNTAPLPGVRDEENFEHARFPSQCTCDVQDKKCAKKTKGALQVLALVGVSLPIPTAMELKFLWCGTKLQAATGGSLTREARHDAPRAN